MFGRMLRSLMLNPPVDDEIDEISRFRIPQNAAFLTPPGPFAPTYARSRSVQRTETRDGVQYAIMRRLDGHPDIHDYLWDRAGADIPRECCWVIRAKAAFANPQTNIIFAAARGTHGLRVRLSEEHAARFPDCELEPSSEQGGFRWVSSRLSLDQDRAMLALAYADSKFVVT